MRASFIMRSVWAKKLALSLFLSALPAVAPAQFTYTTNTDGSLNLARYTGSDGAAVIPDTTNGLPVTSIGNDAFLGSASLTNITIGTNVVSIGDEVFSYSGLTSVTIPGSVTNLAFDAFFYCSYLTAINVNSNNSVYSSLDGVLFNSNRTTLIEFPETKAGDYTVPNSVTNIGGDAFFGCADVTSVSIPAGVLAIGSYAFLATYDLTAITVDTNNPNYSSAAGVLFNKSQTTLIQYPPGNIFQSYVMPNTVTNIGIEAFYSSGHLVSVTIGTNVSDIGPASFENCYTLTSMTIPDSVAVIEGDAFARCSGLTNFVIGAGVTNIQYQAFLNCPNLQAISVATNNPAFSSVEGVLFNHYKTTLVLYPAGSSATSYVMPNSVTAIQDDAFFASFNLASVTIGTNVLNIGDGVFSHCYNLTSISIPNSVTNLGFSTFFDCFNMTNVTIGTGVTTLGFQDFAYCDSLAGIYFEGNAPSFSSDVFDNDIDAVVYYLAGTSGWSAPYDGLPIALWLPYIQTGDASFGQHTNGFGFTINWANGQTVVIQASTNLANPAWAPVGTNVFTDVSSFFTDSRWTNYPCRFYRLMP